MLFWMRLTLWVHKIHLKFGLKMVEGSGAVKFKLGAGLGAVARLK